MTIEKSLTQQQVLCQAFSVSKKYFRPAVRILKLSKSFKILLIERAVGFLPPAHTPRYSVPDIFCEVF